MKNKKKIEEIERIVQKKKGLSNTMGDVKIGHGCKWRLKKSRKN